MKNFKKLYLHNSIFRFMISYAAVLLIPLLVCLLSYQLTFNTVKEEIEENNLSMLTRSKNLIDDQVQTLRTSMLQSADNSKIINFVKEQPDVKPLNQYYSKALSAISELSYIFKYSNADILNDVYIYVPKSDYIVTRYDLYKSELYHQMVLNDKTNYEDWISLLTNKEVYQQYIVGEKMITLLQKVPSAINRPAEGVVVCNISKSAIQKYFENLHIEEGASLFITDKHNQVMFEMAEDNISMPELTEKEKQASVISKKVNGVDSTILTVNSNETGWQYTLVIPDKVIMFKLTDLKMTIAMLFLLAVLLGITISYMMAKKSGKPIEEIKQQLIEMKEDIEVENISSTSTLSGTLSKIVSQKQVLVNELETQRPYLEAALFQKLIKGEFISDKELNYICQKTKIKLDAEAYWVINSRFFGNNDMFNLDEQTLEDVNLLKILLKEKIQSIITDQMFFYDLDQLTITIILPKTGNMSYQVIKEKISEINTEMLEQYKVTPYWGISDECINLLQLWRAFEQSKSALKSGIKEGENRLVEYSNNVVEQDSFYYPTVLEKQLITYIKKSDLEGIKKLMDMLYVENFTNRHLGEDTIDKLYTLMKGAIPKITEDEDTQFYIASIDEYMKQKNPESVKACFEKLTSLYLNISSTFSQEKKKQQSKLIHKITDYINEHYSDANLGLGMIATNFNISEGYVSSLFKEQAGINFTEYVETQRINKACDLLKNTSLSISDIGAQVGYNSVQSFRRAFKRLHGVSPSELRK